jgi:hypothetical protein
MCVSTGTPHPCREREQADAVRVFSPDAEEAQSALACGGPVRPPPRSRRQSPATRAPPTTRRARKPSPARAASLRHRRSRRAPETPQRDAPPRPRAARRTRRRRAEHAADPEMGATERTKRNEKKHSRVLPHHPNAGCRAHASAKRRRPRTRFGEAREGRRSSSRKDGTHACCAFRAVRFHHRSPSAPWTGASSAAPPLPAQAPSPVPAPAEHLPARQGWRPDPRSSKPNRAIWPDSTKEYTIRPGARPLTRWRQGRPDGPFPPRERFHKSSMTDVWHVCTPR